MNVDSMLKKTKKSEMTKKEKLNNRISTVFAVLFLVGCLVFALLARGQKEGMVGPSIFGFRSFKALSASMAPAIRPGAFIITIERNGDDMQVGDIIAYRSKSKDTTVVTHRIAEVTQEEGDLAIYTRGDATMTVDPAAVTRERLLGVVVFVFNGFQTLFSIPGILSVLFFLLLLGLAFSLVPRFITEIIYLIFYRR